MDVEGIFTGLLQREGGWRDATQRPDGTWDPPTNLGITLPTLKAYREKYLGTPADETTAASLFVLTEDEARQIYAIRYVQEPGFTEENIPFEPLRVQLIDFGVNSGPERAVRWLQRVLRIAATGQMDAYTVACLKNLDGLRLGLATGTTGTMPSVLAIVNDALVAARSYMIDQAVDHGTIRKQDEEGVESRALSFFLARP